MSFYKTKILVALKKFLVMSMSYKKNRCLEISKDYVLLMGSNPKCFKYFHWWTTLFLPTCSTRSYSIFFLVIFFYVLIVWQNNENMSVYSYGSAIRSQSNVMYTFLCSDHLRTWLYPKNSPHSLNFFFTFFFVFFFPFFGVPDFICVREKIPCVF